MQIFESYNSGCYFVLFVLKSKNFSIEFCVNYIITISTVL